MSATLARSTAPVARDALVGIDQPVPLLDGRFVPYVNLDNAASTPAFRSVVRAIDEFLPFYSGVHRGTGYKSRLSTATFERARELVGEFLGADPERDVVVFTKNTTEAINKLARALPVETDAVVLTTMLEHHSNDLPWRSRLRTVHVGVCPDGTLDVDDLDRRLAEHAGRIALLAVSGASNVTGVVQPVHQLAERVHAAGGRILVDAAQLAPHRPIDMRAHDDPGHLDFVVLSAHKMYAPYGTGVLVGPRCAFGPTPDHAGGGTVNAVTTDTVAWADLPDREEAGSPNVLGAVALAAATRALTEIGLDHIAAHESELTRYAIDRLAEVPGLRIHGPTDTSDPTAKLGVIPFTIDGIDHTPDRRSPRLRAWCRRAQRMLLRPSIHRPSPRVSTTPPRWPGSIGCGTATNAGRRAWSGSASAVTTTGATSISPSPRWSRSSPATSPATIEPTSTAHFDPAGYIEPTLYSLDAP